MSVVYYKININVFFFLNSFSGGGFSCYSVYVKKIKSHEIGSFEDTITKPLILSFSFCFTG